MAKVVLDMTLSLDGFIASPDGDDAGLHAWVFGGSVPLKVGEWTFKLASAKDAEVFREYVDRVGAFILGNTSFKQMPGDSPFNVPSFVLTHEARAPIVRERFTTTFVTEGIEKALELAQEAAGNKDVYIFGGARTAQQYLNAKRVDELQINLVSKFLGQGKRLFEAISPEAMFAQVEVVEGAGVTYLRYRKVRA